MCIKARTKDVQRSLFSNVWASWADWLDKFQSMYFVTASPLSMIFNNQLFFLGNKLCFSDLAQNIPKNFGSSHHASVVGGSKCTLRLNSEKWYFVTKNCGKRIVLVTSNFF